MPRPKTKLELQQACRQNFDKLENFINGLSSDELKKEFPVQYLNRNIRDVLAHLHHWHLFFLTWYQVGLTGESPAIPAAGYTWKTLPKLNLEIRDKYSNMSLAQAQSLLKESHRQVADLIDQLSEDVLFEKKKFKWTGTTSLAAYAISNTSSHYDWAWKLIRKSLKAQA